MPNVYDTHILDSEFLGVSEHKILFQSEPEGIAILLLPLNGQIPAEQPSDASGSPG